MHVAFQGRWRLTAHQNAAGEWVAQVWKRYTPTSVAVYADTFASKTLAVDWLARIAEMKEPAP